MHCDDKRMLWILKQEIASCWENLTKSNFEDNGALNELNNSIIEYNEYKKSLTEN